MDMTLRSGSPDDEVFVTRNGQSVELRSRKSTPESADGLVELTASMMTVKPGRPSMSTDHGTESLIKVSGCNSRSSPSYSDQDYILEVRPPSTTRVSQDIGTATTTHPDGLRPIFAPPIVFMSRSPSPRVGVPLYPTMPILLPEEVTWKQTPPIPVSPVSSIRNRLLGEESTVPLRSVSTSTHAGSAPVHATTKDARAGNTLPVTIETDSMNPSRIRRTARSADRFNSESDWSSTPTDSERRNDDLLCAPLPLPWGFASTTQQSTSGAAAPCSPRFSPTPPYVMPPWPPSAETTHPSDVLLSSPEVIAGTRTERINRRCARSLGMSTSPSPRLGAISDPASTPPPSRSSPPSAPLRRTRFAPTLSSSPGSSLRTSAFNSSYYVKSVGASSGSWGTLGVAPDTTAPPTINNSRLASRSTSQGSRGTLPDTNENHPWSSTLSNLSDVELLHPPVTYPGYFTPQASESTQSPTSSRFVLICGTCGCPPITCNCGRHPRAPISTPATPSGTRAPMRHIATPHPIFWFADGTVLFEVSNS